MIIYSKEAAFFFLKDGRERITEKIESVSIQENNNKEAIHLTKVIKYERGKTNELLNNNSVCL